MNDHATEPLRAQARRAPVGLRPDLGRSHRLVLAVLSAIALLLIASGTAAAAGGWSTPKLIDSQFVPHSVACASPKFCVAIGGGEERTNDGGRWTTRRWIDSHPGPLGLSSISCTPRNRFCVVVGSGGDAIAFSHDRWGAPRKIDSHEGLVSISCPTASFCVAVDRSGYVVRRIGGWRAPQKIDPHGGLTSVSCASPSFCIAVDSRGDALTYEGGHWRLNRIDAKGGLTSVSCAPLRRFCAAVDTHGDVINYGDHWHAPRTIDPTGFGLTSVSCGLSGRGFVYCNAVDGKGHPVDYIKGSWTRAKGLYVYGGLASISCVTGALFCYAVGYPGGAIYFAHYNWHPATVGGGSLSISCPKVSFCVAVDYAGNALTRHGSRWSKPKLIDRRGGLTAVSCVSPSFCIAVDRQGNALTLRGRRWSAPRPIDRFGAGLTSVSCPLRSFCVAVDANDRALMYRRGRWGSPKKIDSNDGKPYNGLESVSCTGPSFCEAVDQHNAIAYNGRGWGKPENIDAQGGTMISVSCSSRVFCIEVDYEGDARYYHYGTWSRSTGPDAQGGQLNSLSCVSNTFCVAVGLTDAIVYSGKISWTPPTPVDTAQILSGVSCASPRLCVAVDQKGDALTYRPPK